MGQCLVVTQTAQEVEHYLLIFGLELLHLLALPRGQSQELELSTQVYRAKPRKVIQQFQQLNKCLKC
jgi:hypothetical protein